MFPTRPVIIDEKARTFHRCLRVGLNSGVENRKSLGLVDVASSFFLL